MFKSIRAKLLVTSMTTIILAVLVMAIIHYSNAKSLLVESRQAIDSKAIANSSLLFKQYTQRLVYEFESHTQLYSDKHKIYYAEPDFKGYFEKLTNSFPTILYVDEKGGVPIVVGSQIIARSEEMNKHPIFERAVKEPSKAQFQLERIKDELFLVFLNYRKSFFDEFNGGYGAYIPLKKIVSDIELISLDKEGILSIFDTISGKMYNVSNQAEIPVDNTLSASIKQCTEKHVGCSFEGDFLGKNSYINIRPDEYLKITLIYGVPKNILLKKVNDSLLKILITAFLLISLTLTVINIFSKRLTQPLSLLAKVAEKIGLGEFNTEINIHTNDEAGDLASSFRKMVTDLRAVTVSKDYVENIIHSISEMLLVVNDSGAIMKLNKSVASRFAKNEKDLLGTNVNEFIEDFDFKNYVAFIVGGAEKGTAKIFKLKMPSGISLPVTLSCTNLNDEKSAVRNYILVIQDMTAALREAEAAKRVSYLVDNMQESMFSVTSSFEIIEPVSKYSQEVFGIEIVNKNLLDTVFKDMPRDGEAFGRLKSALNTVFGEDDLQWMLMEGNFPEKIEYQEPGSDAKKKLKIKASPLWSQDGELEKILFVVADITELELKEQKTAEQQRANRIIEDIIQCKADRFVQVISQALNVLQVAINHDYTGVSKEALNQTYRDLHTIKGNARFLGLNRLATQVHEVESKVLPLADSLMSAGASKGKSARIMQEELKLIFDLVNDYKRIEHDSFQKRSQASTPIPQEYVKDFLSLFSQLSGKFSFESLDKLKQFIMFGSGRSIKRTVQELSDFVSDLSKRRNKPVQLKMFGDDIVLDERIFSPVTDSLGHLVRNAFDHGIESPENRRQAGKPDEAKINISWSVADSKLKIDIADDGKGFDLEKIRVKLVEKNHCSADAAASLTNEKLIESVFLPAFSTADAVSETSGRGVGLDAVRDAIEKVHGRITIDSHQGIGTTIHLEIPMGQSA